MKFWYNTNSLKCYDKEKIALRIETTINQPKEYKVFRNKEGEADDQPKSWQHLRKGVADMPRRAEVADAANKRLAESLASVAETTTLGELLKPLGEPVLDQKGRRKARGRQSADGQRRRTVRHLGSRGIPDQRLPQSRSAREVVW